MSYTTFKNEIPSNWLIAGFLLNIFRGSRAYTQRVVIFYFKYSLFRGQVDTQKVKIKAVREFLFISTRVTTIPHFKTHKTFILLSRDFNNKKTLTQLDPCKVWYARNWWILTNYFWKYRSYYIYLELVLFQPWGMSSHVGVLFSKSELFRNENISPNIIPYWKHWNLNITGNYSTLKEFKPQNQTLNYAI